jgi:hypothetical protein
MIKLQSIIQSMSEPTVLYYPFHAINEFMLEEYRQQVIREVFSNLNLLNNSRKSAILSLFKRYVKLSGFRDVGQAPLGLKVRGSIAAFQDHADFAAQLMAAWCELRSELAGQIFEFLKAREWELLPVDADRTKLPGFLIIWPKGETFEVLVKSFREMVAETPASDDDISLMIVWLAGRLPYDVMEQQTEE